MFLNTTYETKYETTKNNPNKIPNTIVLNILSNWKLISCTPAGYIFLNSKSFKSSTKNEVNAI